MLKGKQSLVSDLDKVKATCKNHACPSHLQYTLRYMTLSYYNLNAHFLQLGFLLCRNTLIGNKRDMDPRNAAMLRAVGAETVSP